MYSDGTKLVDLGDYDNQGDNLLTLNDWVTLYEAKAGIKLNPGTMRKRRFISGLGQLVPPRVYVLTREEFERVLATPLPMCKNVVKNL